MKSPGKIYWKTLLTLAGFKLALQFLLLRTDYGFHRDEFLYLALGNHLDWGYWSNPPFIGFVAFLSQTLLGDSLLAVRFFPILAGAGLVILAGLMARELHGGWYAQALAGLTIIFSPAYLRTFGMLQPVSFDILFWSLAFYCLLRYINTQEVKFMYALSITVAIGMLNKYSLVFFIACLGISLILSEHRKIFTRSSTWKAIALGILILVPNLIWQYSYNFPVVSHMSELAENQLSNVSPVNFLMDQVWMQFSGTLIWVPGLLLLLLGKEHGVYRFIAYFYLSLLLLFLILNGKSYYTLGVYPVLLAAGAVCAEIWIKATWVKIMLPILLLIGSLISLPIGRPLWSPNDQIAFYQKMEQDYGLTVGRTWEDGQVHPLPQDFADMLGWEELSSLAIKAYENADNPQRCLIYCENYGQAGAVDFLSKDKLPPVISFSDTYRLWAPIAIPDFEAVVYINDELGEDIANLFESIELIGTVQTAHAREQGTQVYLCQYPKSSFNDFWKERVEIVIASYSR